jgi:soluble lytic murein transglycosylase-like protein
LLLSVAALTTIIFLAVFHHQATNYQKAINQTTTQLQQKRDRDINDLKLKLQKSEQDNQSKDKQIQDLQQQVSVKKQQQEAARLAAAQAAQSAPSSQVASSGNCAAYEPLVAQYGWNVSVAMAVMQAESGCNPTASSPTCDHGLMQINCVHAAAVGGNLSLLNDPATNIRVAFAVYSGAGWSAWTTYTSGAYTRYL